MTNLDELIQEQPDYMHECLKTFISEKDGKIRVNWSAIASHEREYHASEEMIERTYDILRKLGVLSLRSCENYLITGADVAINPRGALLTMHYFTRLDDAKAFREAFYKDAMYNTPIFQGLKE